VDYAAFTRLWAMGKEGGKGRGSGSGGTKRGKMVSQSSSYYIEGRETGISKGVLVQDGHDTMTTTLRQGRMEAQALH